MRYDGNEIVIQASRAATGTLRELSSAPTVESGFWGATLRLQFDDEPIHLLKGARFKDAVDFSDSIRSDWEAANQAEFEISRRAIDALLLEIEGLANTVAYPAACVVAPILERARGLDQRLLSKLPQEALEDVHRDQIKKTQSFVQHAQQIRQQAISAFEERQLFEWSDFFETFESNPLTPEQRESIVSDEDATLVLAGAGSGKTSVITAKAGYLLKSGARRPEEVLLLAFASAAAKEMSERIEAKCGEPLEARTFHSLAYDIIGTVEGSKPALAAHATDDKAYLALIRDILRALVKTASEVSKSIVGWFSHTRLDERSEWDFKKKHSYYTYIEKLDLRTLQGEQVKSLEELMIANWLYENGIAYEYEPNYEHKVSEGGFSDYCPDFRLSKSGIYLEHFGVRRTKTADGTYRLTTAPFVDREEYLEGMEWKRGVHAEHETTLIETFSYEREDGQLLEALAEKIAPFETVSPRSPETLFDKVVELNQADSFVQLLGTFLKHYKGGGYQLSECAEKGRTLKLGKRAKAFLSIFEPVYLEYQNQLDGRIDFEDMIFRATKYAETGEYISPFKHILVDEFQDISRSRGRLVKALKAQHSDARIFAVGDDWQSIYRFAGSDINLMRNFGDKFGGAFDGQSGVHRTVDLGRTFRSVDQIAHAAKRFVLQNPAQLNKTVIPAGTSDVPALKVVSTIKTDEKSKLKQVLQSLQGAAEQGKRASVLLLGRYRHLAPSNLSQLRREFPDLEISFRTIHASKGLEADHVVILNMFRGRTGFPSEIVDDPLLSLVSPEAEPFENAEERRVMYVALTRARKSVTLMGSASKQSAFVSELMDDPEYGAVGAHQKEEFNHPCGECGGHLVPVPTKDGRTWYRCEHASLCGNSLNACTACGTGLPVRKEIAGLRKCSCGAEYPSCPNCKDGWLVERRGRYGPFLGCVSYPRCKGKAKISAPKVD
ncbi:UvrD-helicase domain-containing protein [Sulfitobacter sabulilitoris]|uniref:DNA 3'-5' helicase n=1 Tax=Sulfitobacter sabulilitoris TaxID=2562655 RepID=A0A5S3PEZ7_9RHOB|nr:UvrD-helicase domain-containing protein [Sulfitobacter sabulilitoris]TMM51690.1 helicase IV [Sulfitobacter sabulilitoris]